MSLNYELTKIENWKTKCLKETGGVNGLCQSLIFATIPVGIYEITEKNWKKFYARLHFCETVHGPYLMRNGEPSMITPEEVKGYIGLSTNASTLTDSQFLKRFAYVVRDIEAGVL